MRVAYRVLSQVLIAGATGWLVGLGYAYSRFRYQDYGVWDWFFASGEAGTTTAWFGAAIFAGIRLAWWRT